MVFKVATDGTYTVPYFVSAHIVDQRGTVVAQCDSRLTGLWLDPRADQIVTLTIRQPWLLPGEYSVDLFVCNAGVIDSLEGACHLTVTPDLPYPGGAIDEALAASSVLADFRYESDESPIKQEPPSRPQPTDSGERALS